MRRKTRPQPTQEVKQEPVAVEEPTTNTEPVANTEETNTEETSTEVVLRRPRKKIRRPTLSDTVSAIPVAAFHRMARHMAEDCKSDLRWEGEALQALQTGAEAYMIERFQKAKDIMDLFGRSTSGKHLNSLLREGLC